MHNKGVVLLERPTVFLAWFALASAALSPVWQLFAEGYMETLVYIVNAGAALGSAGVPSLNTTATPAVIGTAFVAAIALFVASPYHGLAWKIRWSTSTLLLLSAVHVILLSVQIRVAAADLEVLREAPHSFTTGRVLMPAAGVAESGGIGAWYWLFPLLTTTVWFVAMQRRQPQD